MFSLVRNGPLKCFKTLRMQILHSSHTDQHAKEPQVFSVIFIQPGSINMKSMADEENHGVVSTDDQD